ncbi:hypothetical protein V6N12_069706 [Hibiscus sabdariffa]|uniref:Uncharacterized protein n=1 Tax=Hibiscus sabdariffa TaxID=183260 RepID=A0ABR2FER9_9ROSI
MEIKHGGGGDQPRLSKRGDGGPSRSDYGERHGVGINLCGNRSPRGSEDSDESNDISDVAPKLRVEDECSDRCRPSTEEEAFQTMCTERDAINAVSREEEALRRQINISELMGGEPNVLPVESVEDSNGELGLDLAILDGPGTGSLIPKTGLEFNSKEGELALGSKEAMGPVAHEVGRNFESPQARILSWADRVKLNAGPLDLRFNYVEGNNDDSDGNFSVDCEQLQRLSVDGGNLGVQDKGDGDRTGLLLGGESL